MKQLKPYNVYCTKYKSHSVTLTLVKPAIFGKIDLKAFFLFSTKHEYCGLYS